ncbi:hypothetical protein [Planctomicrobium sp. SH527]|uniref:hypothetical protein n=1 Tax=Planctomicrobium sp. SH527 TaxID=3448123 RepID=UPI003F5B660C
MNFTFLVLSTAFVLALGFTNHSLHADGKSTSAVPEKSVESRVSEALAKLSVSDRAAVLSQRYCPLMSRERLGAMGAPIKVTIEGTELFVCCEGCSDEAVKHSKETLATVGRLKRCTVALAKLPAADQILAEAQLFCPIAEGSRLGGMGPPVKVLLDGQPVFVCCKPCVAKAQLDKKATLARVKEIQQENSKASHH